MAHVYPTSVDLIALNFFQALCNKSEAETRAEKTIIPPPRPLVNSIFGTAQGREDLWPVTHACRNKAEKTTTRRLLN